MSLSPDERRAVGDAWGALAGVVVDACKSHHECHCAPTHVEARRLPREPTEMTVHKTRCVPSAAPEKWKTTLAMAATTTDEYLTVLDMHLLPAGKPMSTVAVGAAPEPDHVAPSTHASRVTVGVEQITPPGLYVGHVGVTNTPTSIPVIIFIDGMD